jgi:Fic family protein
MLSYTAATGGLYKGNDNIITEVEADGTRRVRFVPVKAAEAPKAMNQLVLAYLEARGNYNINQLLLIPCFILDFLCIHPFADGNGRLSRLLSLLLLYKNGFDAGRYISFEEQINRKKAAYYQALKDSSGGRHEGRNSYFPFIENFVMTLLYCYKELDSRFAAVGSAKATKRRRIEFTVLNSLLPISKSEICHILPDVSPTTVEAALAEMLKNGQIEKVGAARNTKYKAARKSSP